MCASRIIMCATCSSVFLSTDHLTDTGEATDSGSADGSTIRVGLQAAGTQIRSAGEITNQAVVCIFHICIRDAGRPSVSVTWLAVWNQSLGLK